MSKLLLNKPMMLFIKHPFHRSDLIHTGNIYMQLYSGPGALTPTEISAIEALGTSGLYNLPAIDTEMRKTRSELALLTQANTTVASYISGFPGKSSGDNADETVINMTQRVESLFASTSGTPGLLFVQFMGPATGGTQTRFLLAFSVGAEGSGADVILPTNIVAGERYKVGNIRYKLANLLGEI